MKIEFYTREVESSNIKSLGRCPMRDLMLVEFLNGTKYLYFDVSSKLFNDLVMAESVGKLFNTTIKGGGFDYMRIS